MRIPTTILLAFALAVYLNRFNPIYAALNLTLLAAYAFFDFVEPRTHVRHLARFGIVTLMVMLLVVVPTWLEIQARYTSAPYEHIHDGAIQTEQAIQFLLAGKNPYVEDYTQTPMAQWEPYFGLEPASNPALFYLPYLPLSFIAPLPFYLAFQTWFGFFDLRIYQLILFVGLFGLLFQLTPDWERKLALAILVPLNPLFVPAFIEGRNDVVVLWWLGLMIYFLQRRWVAMATVALGLACAVKATAWFAVPFFVTHLWLNAFRDPRGWATRVVGPLSLIGILFILPFVIWDARAFVADTLWYQSSAFQITGQGFSRILLGVGILADKWAVFPFTLVQFLVGLPTLMLLIRWQAARPLIQRMIAAMAVFGFVIGFFGRAFADNHIGFVLSLALLALGTGEE